MSNSTPKRRLFRKGPTFSRRGLDEKLETILSGLDAGRVLDLGSKRAPYRRWIRAERFETLDILPDGEPDVVGDAHRLPLRAGVYDTVIATQVLEHCHTPQQVVDEIHRVLRPGGSLVVSVPFVYVIHADPHDYWRFTEYALRHILREFADVEVQAWGNRATIIWDMISARPSFLKYLNGLLSPLLKPSRVNRHCPQGYIVVARKADE